MLIQDHCLWQLLNIRVKWYSEFAVQLKCIIVGPSYQICDFVLVGISPALKQLAPNKSRDPVGLKMWCENEIPFLGSASMYPKQQSGIRYQYSGILFKRGRFIKMKMAYFAPILSLLTLFYGRRKETSSKLSFERNILIRIRRYSTNYTHENDLSMDRIF